MYKTVVPFLFGSYGFLCVIEVIYFSIIPFILVSPK